MKNAYYHLVKAALNIKGKPGKDRLLDETVGDVQSYIRSYNQRITKKGEVKSERGPDPVIAETNKRMRLIF